MPFRASRPALARQERSASESDGQGAESAARAAPWGRLEAVQKVLTRALGRSRGAPLWAVCVCGSSGQSGVSSVG